MEQPHIDKIPSMSRYHFCDTQNAFATVNKTQKNMMTTYIIGGTFTFC